MTLPQNFSSKLSRMLHAECATYKAYLELLSEQRGTITVFNTEKLKKLDAKRKEITRKLKAFHEERVALLSDGAVEGEAKLSSIIERFGSESEKAQLIPLVDELIRLIGAARHEAGEFQGVQTFALNVVNGSLSLIMRATRHVSKQYGRQGKISESYIPRSSRHEGVLKQA